jgi:hypothetical protein
MKFIMKKQSILLILALITSIPALVIFANVVYYALLGAGFLIEGTPDINAARGVVVWLSSTLTVCLAGAASLA